MLRVQSPLEYLSCRDIQLILNTQFINCPKAPGIFFFFKKFIFQDDFSFFWNEYFPISVVLKLVIHKNLDWIESNISRFLLEKVDSFTLEFSNFLSV